MAKEIFEIRLHGRGGQGAKTAAALLADAAIEQGKFVQSFPEYGAERQGAPIKAFTRISDKRILIHTGVTQPDLVAVFDPTLLKSIAVAEGLDEEKGVLVVNTTQSNDEVRQLTGFKGRIVVIDAVKIALEELGRAVTNTAMLGAIERATNIVDYQHLKDNMLEHFTHELGKDLADKNVNAFVRAYNEVKVN